MTKTIPVFYTPKQSLNKKMGFSPSPMKPKLLAEHWQRLSLPIEIIAPLPVTNDVYKKAHDPIYVDGLFNQTALNGFGNTNKQLLKTLPYLTGSVVDAGRSVLNHQSEVAFSLSSGSHHARYDSGGGFCTLNHNVTAAMLLREEFNLNKVGFVDGDAHFCNGDADIKKTLKLDWLQIYSFGEEFLCSSDANKWLQQFHQICLAFEGCDLLIYNAGVDPHINDPLGGVLTTKQLKHRDAIVFETMKLLQIPCVVTLAGAYVDSTHDSLNPILELHTQTLIEAIRVY